MGYTNYWRAPRVLEKQAFIAFADDCRKICESLPVGLAGASGEGKPEFGQDEICFNGISPNDDHEPFIINRKLVIIDPKHFCSQPDENGLYFDFCKTERKPYDLCVKCCLVLLKAYFPQVKISSDGGRDEEVCVEGEQLRVRDRVAREAGDVPGLARVRAELVHGDAFFAVDPAA